MTPDEIVSTIRRMPLSPASQAELLRAAAAGQRWALVLVRMHAWRQRQAARLDRTWLARLWARIWR